MGGIPKYFKNNYSYAASLAALSGLYPMLFYYSNNLTMISTGRHFLYFSLIFIGIPVSISLLLTWLFQTVTVLKPYREHLSFFLPLGIIVVLMVQVTNLKLEVLLILGFLSVVLVLTLFLYKHHKKIILFIGLVSPMPLFKTALSVYDHLVPTSWQALPDQVEATVLKNKPNIYLIQPDGYIGEKVLKSATYNHDSELYDWLRSKRFKLYENYRSNYTTSLASNSCLFAMKQHAYEGMVMPELEYPGARTIISGKNPVIRILKNNDYKSFLVTENEYFQQCVDQVEYDYKNIDAADIPFFSNGFTMRRDVLADLKEKMNIEVRGPKFFFIQKLVPHHVQFTTEENRIEVEREWYASRVDLANNWIEETVTYIEEKDPNALIIILADHGGYVGLSSYKELFGTEDETHFASIYSALAAVKWNGYNNAKGWDDKHMRSSANVFRVLFSILSDNQELLDHLEDNSSYNLSKERFHLKKVRRVLDDQGRVVQD